MRSFWLTCSQVGIYHEYSNHTLFVTQRHTTAVSGFAACLSRLAEAEWARSCEHVRKFAPSIGTVGEWRALCEGGWLNPMPGDLPDPSINDGIDLGKSHPVPVSPVPSLPVASGANIGSPANTSEDTALSTSSSNPRAPNSIRKTSDHSGMEQLRTYPVASRPPSPPTTGDIMTHALQNNFVSELDHQPFTPSNRPEDMVDSGGSAISSSNRSLAMVDSSRLNDSAAVANSTSHLSNVEVVSTDNQQRSVENPEFTPDHAIKLTIKGTELPSSQPVPSSPNYLPSERGQLKVAKKPNVDVVNEREPERQTAGSPENTRPLEGGISVGGRSLDRRSSIESSNSIVATMRERYDTPSVSYYFTLLNTLHRCCFR